MLDENSIFICHLKTINANRSETRFHSTTHHQEKTIKYQECDNINPDINDSIESHEFNSAINIMLDE